MNNITFYTLIAIEKEAWLFGAPVYEGKKRSANIQSVSRDLF